MVRLLPYGPHAVLAEYQSLADVLGVAERLRSLDLPDVVEIVPAARTILVQHRGARSDALDAALRTVVPFTPPRREPVTVPVRYDGEDLPAVAAASGLRVDDVVTLHAGATYTAAFCGFVPGFTYLVGLDARLQLARRSTPRPRVPPGSVAIAGEYTGVYPSASPGGWHLLGTTDAVLWDEARPEPALVPPGATVRFVAT